MHLGWSRDEAGKTMGLAPYGNKILLSLIFSMEIKEILIFFILIPKKILLKKLL
jgi:predicted NodU family carbamoyl transferase